MSQFPRVAEVALSVILLNSFKGRTRCKIVYLLFKSTKTCSERILANAIFCDTSTSFPDGCYLHLVNTGINSSTDAPDDHSSI